MVSGCVLLRLPVAMRRAPPACKVVRSAAVFGSRWIAVPMVRPANGCELANSAAVACSRRQFDPIQSMRVLVSDDDMAEYSDFGGRRARRQAFIDLLAAILRLAPPK